MKLLEKAKEGLVVNEVEGYLMGVWRDELLPTLWRFIAYII